MKTKIVGLIALLIGLTSGLNANESLLRVKTYSHYLKGSGGNYPAISYLSIQAKDDIEIQSVDINRGACQEYLSEVNIAMDLVLNPFGNAKRKNDAIRQYSEKTGKPIILKFGEILKLYTKCQYDEILEVKIETNKGEFVLQP